MSEKTKVLIVGGGFAGTKAALELAKCSECEVTLLSDRSHFRYYPMLYATATGGKRAGSRIRLQNIFKGLPVNLVKGTATKLDRQKKVVTTEAGETLAYDSLVLALGNITNYFGIEGLAEHSYGIKSTEEAERFKKHLHEQFIANGCPDLNYVIVGGGPTGIELAGELPSYLRAIIKSHGIAKKCDLNIKIVEALPRLLPRSPEKLSKAIAKRLTDLGIEVMLDTAVKGQTADSLMLGDKPLKTQTVVWTAGVTNHPFFKENNFKLTERGKVEVDEYLQTEPDIYVLGDNANTPFSGMAQTALRDGHFVAHNIELKLEGKEPLKYVPKKPIAVTPVGPLWAAVEWGKFTFAGKIGWVLRAAADLIGFHDIESWPKAGAQWLTSMRPGEHMCPQCDKTPEAQTAKPA